MAEGGPFGFFRGLNTKASAYTIPQDSLSDAQNVRLSYGDLVKRTGSTQLNATALSGTPVITGLFDWQASGGQRYAICTAGTNIFKMEDLDGTWDSITGLVTITAGQNNQFTFASLNNVLVCANGVDALIRWNGIGNAAILGGSPPIFSMLAAANNILFGAGQSANVSRIQWPAINDAETWPSQNFVDFRLNDGDRIVAIATLGNEIAVFKRKSIGILGNRPLSVVSTPLLGELMTLTTFTTGIGCAGKLAVDNLDDGRVVFMGSNAHVYIFDGKELEDIGDQEPPLGSIQTTLNALPMGRLQYSIVRYYPTRQEIWISVSTGSSSTNNRVYIYDLIFRSWFPFTGIAANAMASIIDTRSTTINSYVMLTGNYAGRVYEQDRGNSNAEDTNSVIDGYGTISVQLGNDARRFLPVSLIVPTESQTSDYNLEVNYGFGGFTNVSKSKQISLYQGGATLDNFILSTDILGGTSTLRKVITLLHDGKSSSIQIQFRNKSASQPFTVHPVTLSTEVLV